jgi:hypothetical protein
MACHVQLIVRGLAVGRLSAGCRSCGMLGVAAVEDRFLAPEVPEPGVSKGFGKWVLKFS